VQVRGDVAGRQAAAVQHEDLVVTPLKATLALAHDLRGEAPVPVTRRVNPDRAVLGDQRLRRRPVPSVPGPAGRFLVRFVAEVVGQLDLHRPLHQALGQLGEQPAGPGDLLLRRGAGEQLINHLIADPPVDRHPKRSIDPAAAHRPIYRPTADLVHGVVPMGVQCAARGFARLGSQCGGRNANAFRATRLFSCSDRCTTIGAYHLADEERSSRASQKFDNPSYLIGFAEST